MRVARLLIAITCFVALPLAAETPATPAPEAVEASSDLRVQAIRPGLNVISGAGGNVVAWSGEDGVVLVDSGLASTAALLAAAVERSAPGTVRFLVNTHGHADHVGGNEVFARAGAVVIGHEMLLERRGRDPAVPAGGGNEAAAAAAPMITTTDTLALHFNGDRLEVVHVADAHTAGDLVVRWNDLDVVALGDLYWSGQYPYIDVESGGSLAGTVAAIEAVLARSNARTVVVPGHGPVSNRAELAAYRDMLVAVGRDVRVAVEQGQGLEAILAGRPTAEFDARYGRPGALVTPEQFVRSVYSDLAQKRPSR
jgi:glyoxylase-like metal-dependent hydrolase (beta-lactamase superfamily II)